VLSGERSLYWKLTARENLEYFAALYHVPSAETPARIVDILEAVHLTDRADDYVEKFSTGMRQRLVLARALLPAPSLLLLDEPTVGLDPQAARDLRERVLQLRDEGRTVLLTTHYMEEADQLCDRIAIVDHGRIVALDTPDRLKRSLSGSEVVRIEITSPERSEPAIMGRLNGSATVTQREEVDGTLHLTVQCSSARDLVPLAIDAARAADAELRNIQVQPISLEDVFISLTGRALRE
jgi:ABC-2 type transport system ATP-binding protein